LFDKARTKFLSDSDLPRCAGRDLFPADEALIQPAMNRGRIDAQNLRGFANRHHIARRGFRRRFIARNVAIAAQRAHLIRREPLAARRFASMAIENTGDHIIGVMNRQTTQQGNRILVGVQTARLHARQVEIDVREGPTTPAQRQMGAAFGSVHADHDFFQQGT
jgi:hypothetical protein